MTTLSTYLVEETELTTTKCPNSLFDQKLRHIFNHLLSDKKERKEKVNIHEYQGTKMIIKVSHTEISSDLLMCKI